MALVAPPATLRPIGSEQLSESVTAPLLQRVAEHLMMTLNSAPPGTSDEPNGLISAAHHALHAILEAPSATVTSFVDRYFANLLSVSIISIGSLSCALQEGDTGESDKTLLFLRDAFATADALLRRADREDMCEFLSEPNMLKLSNKIAILRKLLQL